MATDDLFDGGSRRFLIAAAVAQYSYDPAWDRPGLVQARATMIEVFTEKLGYTLVPTPGLNPTAAQLLDGLDEFCASPERRPEDIVAIYLTAHGERLAYTDDHVIYTADTHPDKTRLATRTADIAHRILCDTRVRRLLLIIDTCFSGKGGADFATAALDRYTHHWEEEPGNGVVVISSAQPSQLAETGAFPRLFSAAVELLSAAGDVSGTIGVQALVAAMNSLAAGPGWQAVGSNEVRLVGRAPAFLPNPRNEYVLPGACDVWMRRLATRSPSRVATARVFLDELRSAAHGSFAARLEEVLHQPPAWLREDDTGDGWATIGCLASMAESAVAWQAFVKAANAAKRVGDLDAYAYLVVIAYIQRTGEALACDEDKGDAELDLSALEDFDDEVLARLGSAVEVFRAAFEMDLAKCREKAEIAVASLGLTDPFGVLHAPESAVPVVRFDSELRDIVVVTILRQLAVSMLVPGSADQLGVGSGLATRALRGNPVTRDMADDGVRLARWAVQLRPKSEGARLTLAQTRLAVLVSTSARSASDIEGGFSRRAKEIEVEAMSVRKALSKWGGSTEVALVVAARARSVQGDFDGALRILRPAPEGEATLTESQYPEVIRLSAHIARITGDHDLALELAARNVDRVEGELIRAAVLDQCAGRAVEAKAALFAALELSQGKYHNDFQALLGLSRRFGSLDDSERGTVTAHIDRLGATDPDLAEVMKARVLISKGEHHAALRYVRGLERNELALEAHADVLIALDRAEEAARLVLTEGMRRGDVLLATEALTLAMDNGLHDVAHGIALQLLASSESSRFA
ncbi:caspase family protein [Nocardia takedensis]|uniref:caspase family protein n=1 Tax=Nocardia takedensis TaxID=259390 RepID=UPI003F7733DD